MNEVGEPTRNTLHLFHFNPKVVRRPLPRVLML